MGDAKVLDAVDLLPDGEILLTRRVGGDVRRDERVVIGRLWNQGYSQSEIARAVGVTPSAINQRLRRMEARQVERIGIDDGGDGSDAGGDGEEGNDDDAWRAAELIRARKRRIRAEVVRADRWMESGSS